MFSLTFQAFLKQRLFRGTRFTNKITANRLDIRNHSNIIESPYAEVKISNGSLPDYIFEKFNKFPHKIAVECGLTGRKYSYEQLRTKSVNLNRALRKKLKLKKGDVVGILLPNIPEYPLCILGTLKSGLVVTTISPLYTAAEINRQLRDIDAKAIITICKLWNVARDAVKGISTQFPIITIKTEKSETTPPGTINFEELANTKYDIPDVPPAESDDIAIIPYSSGTTGLPKGVLHTNQSLISIPCQLKLQDLQFYYETTDTHQDVSPAIIPFFHIYGLSVILLSNLSELVKIVSLPFFQPELLLNTLINYRPAFLCAVPPIVLLMSNNQIFKKRHFESFRYICSGAAPLGAMDQEKFYNKAGKDLHIIQGYGLTEAPVSTSNPNIKDKNVPGSVGTLIPNTIGKILPIDDIHGDPLGCNQKGELFVKGPQVMKGYHNKLEDTEKTIIDGWLRTGDLAYYDENKIFHIADRLKELIKVQGYQVAPAELEEVIRSHPSITDAVVIGIPHEKYGEVPRAYVTVKPQTNLDIEKLEGFVAEKVAAYKQVRGGIAVLENIPKTASGKYLRRELKSAYLNSSNSNN